MSLSHPRHRRPSRTPLYVRFGSLAAIPAIAAGALFVINDDDSSPSGTLHASMEGTGGDTGGTSGVPTSNPTIGDPDSNGMPTSSGTAGSPDGTTPSDDGSAGTTEQPPTRDPDDPDTTEPLDPSGTSTPRPTTPDDPPDTPTDDPTSDPTWPDDPIEPDEPDTPDEPTDPDDPTTTPPEPPTPPRQAVLSDSERALVDATNAARAQAGCPALRVDADLMEASREHSADMRSRDYVSHVNPDGQTPKDRAENAGYDGSVGENIDRSGLFASVDRVIDEWLSDPADRATLLDCAYTSIGVGKADDDGGILGLGAKTWWTQTLGRD